MSSNII